MPKLQWKRRFGPVSLAQKGLIVCAAVIVALFLLPLGSLNAAAETPGLNTSEPVTFHGEIAKGLKIEMKLFRDGSSVHGTYSYEVFGRDIQVKGTINERGEIALQEFLKGKVTGNFAGRFVTKDRIEGRWSKKRGDKGRSFYLVSTGAPLAATQVSATPKPGKGDREVSPTTKEIRAVPKAEATGRTAPPPTIEARPQTLSSVTQASARATRELPAAQPESKTEAKAQAAERAPAPQPAPLKIEPNQPSSPPQIDLRPVVAEESSKLSPKVEALPRSEEKPSVTGRPVDRPQKKRSIPWAALLDLRVAGAVGGILLLGGGLAWLAIVAGSAAAFRENSALFRQAHAMGLSFLPGIILLALGVGAVLAVFVE